MSSPAPHTTTLSELLGADIAAFKPLAYYDKHMDCIRIELRDCSMTEKRISKYLTILYDNYPGPDQPDCAGLMIKGVKHSFKAWGLPMAGVVMVTSILNQVLKQLP